MSARGDWGHVRDLFERALEQGPADIAAWLDREGVVDELLRSELLSLLDHHRSAGSFLTELASERLLELLADDRPFDPGQILGPYAIVRELGRGGMGRVYLASDRRLGRPVALKAISPDLIADPSHRERLRREARAAGALTHPGICTIYALEEIDGDLYIAAEYVDGRTLREEIDSGRAPAAAEVTRTAQELTSALAAAHALGITHGDLKPENVMRTRDGRLKILDFGLARVETTAAAAGPLAVIARILESEATPIDRRRPDLPSPLVDVIDRCLRKSPAARFASAADIVLALDRIDATRAPGRVVAWWRTHQLAVVALYFAACALAWQIKEWRPGITTAVFVVAGIAATVGGVFRGHPLFAERVHGTGLANERERTAKVTLAVDLLMALALTLDGAILASLRPLAAVLTMAFGVGLALVRLVVEPVTTAATFRQ